MLTKRTFDLRALGIDADVTCDVVATSSPTITRVPLDQHIAARARVDELILEGIRHLASAERNTWEQREARQKMEACFIEARRIISIAFYVTPSMVDPSFAAWVRGAHAEVVAIEWARPDATGGFWPKPKEPPRTAVHLREMPKRWREFQRLIEDEEFAAARRVTASTTPEYPRGFYVRPSDCSEPFIAWVKAHVEPHVSDGLRADLDENGGKVRDFFD
ncbi:hypothetical protein WMF20_04975 [Sorangium sp. So ce834]|uniref:hypothetical protein n=1 Tax=Sorangium sp. So ce834 TaxID=3133321 RepID=UPI003F6314D6